MHIQIIVNDQELCEMGITASELKDSIIGSLDQGGCTSQRQVEYAGFSVDVQSSAPVCEISEPAFEISESLDGTKENELWFSRNIKGRKNNMLS